MLVFLALYQDWVPYLLAIVYVAIHHGVVGVMWPQAVYNHTAALNAPWTWAGIHAFFVLGAAVGSVIAWRFNEKAFAQSKIILDSAGEGIYGLDRDGKVTFLNPAAASLLKWQAKEAIGKAMHQVVRHTRADGSDFADHGSPIFASLKDGARRQATDELSGGRMGRVFLSIMSVLRFSNARNSRVSLLPSEISAGVTSESWLCGKATRVSEPF
jgi:PAS domain-containing protein